MPEFWRSKTRTTLIAPIADWQLGYKVYGTFQLEEKWEQRCCPCIPCCELKHLELKHLPPLSFKPSARTCAFCDSFTLRHAHRHQIRRPSGRTPANLRWDAVVGTAVQPPHPPGSDGGPRARQRALQARRPGRRAFTLSCAACSLLLWSILWRARLPSPLQQHYPSALDRANYIVLSNLLTAHLFPYQVDCPLWLYFSLCNRFSLAVRGFLAITVVDSTCTTHEHDTRTYDCIYSLKVYHCFQVFTYTFASPFQRYTFYPKSRRTCIFGDIGVLCASIPFNIPHFYLFGSPHPYSF